MSANYKECKTEPDDLICGDVHKQIQKFIKKIGFFYEFCIAHCEIINS
jgi:hypothetical protein